MYSYVIKFYEVGNKVLFEYRNKSNENTLIINDHLFESVFSSVEKSLDNVIFWDMYLVSENLNLIVNDYTLFKKVSVRKASDGEAQLNIIKSNVDLHLVDLNIDVIQVVDSNLLIANSKVKQLDYDIENYMKELSNKVIERKNSDYTIDIRNCSIEDISIYCSLKSLNIQASSIKNIEFRSIPDNVISIEFFNIWQGSKIDLLRLNSNITKLKLEDSNIRRLYFTQNTLIFEYLNNKSYFDYIFGCEILSFDNLGIKEYELIKQSAFKEDEKLYFDVAYKLAVLKGHRSGFANWFLKNSVGYGYKPLKAVWFIIASIVVFAGIYSFIDLCEYIMDGYQLIFDFGYLEENLNQFLDKIYFSGITFTTTGYGDIIPNNMVVKIITVIESCLGVTMFSLLIYSLTVRHLSHK